jgi:predicted ArsR family transcriptional regulator
MGTDRRADEIARVAALDHPIRASLYERLAERDTWIGRDEAASLVDVPRAVAAFHLDKLADVGLLQTRYERTSGLSGPGAGRPSKLYRRAEGETSVSLPERRYPLAGDLLATAIETSERTGRPTKRVLAQLAKRAGADLAERLTTVGVEGLVDALREIGYEPRLDGDDIVLRNCPFHELSQQHADLVCRMNLDLIRGVTSRCGPHVRPRLAPRPGDCCVRISHSG